MVAVQPKECEQKFFGNSMYSNVNYLILISTKHLQQVHGHAAQHLDRRRRRIRQYGRRTHHRQKLLCLLPATCHALLSTDLLTC